MVRLGPWAAGARRLAAIIPLVAVGCGDAPDDGRHRFPGERIALEIKGRKLTVEVASDDASRKAGLMHREGLPEDAGMLFIYPAHLEMSFWMKNTSIPLSIAFIDDRGAILQIEDMRPYDESSTRSAARVRYALEVNRGWFERNGIKVGDAFADLEERTRGFRVR
jgi:uncharacterized membrane protein (UPF0127 family)